MREGEGAGNGKGGKNNKDQADFIGDCLGYAAEGSKKGVFRVGGSPRSYGGINVDPREAEEGNSTIGEELGGGEGEGIEGSQGESQEES